MSRLVPAKTLVSAFVITLLIAGAYYQALPGAPSRYHTIQRVPGRISTLNGLPADAQSLCAFDSAGFAALFATGKVTKNGLVRPANSLDFGGILDPNCRFYTWAEQMFLWTTSPASGRRNNPDEHIFDSPAFFDVSPPDSGNQRTLISHEPGTIHAMSVFGRQKGAHHLPIVMSKSGKIMEVLPPVFSKKGKQLVMNAGGDTVEVDKAFAASGTVQPRILDRSGSRIEGIKPLIPVALKDQDIVQPIQLDNTHSIFLKASGEVLETNQGEADNSVLLSQRGSLVYYSIMVNDVYAYLLTGLKTGAIIPLPDFLGRVFPHFPTTSADLAQITGFARTNKVTLPDSNALAIVLKASWVEASSLRDPHHYIRVKAIVPVYKKANHDTWSFRGTKRTTLALVGLHVVGSMPNHPELIWATFEHYKNTPDAGYTYVNTSGTIVTMPRNTSGHWLFCADGAGGPFNQQYMHMAGSNIESNPPFHISAGNTIRWKPFGNATDFFPGDEDPDVAYANTKIIALNNSVHRLLKKGDVRANYNFIGATWTFDGSDGNINNGAGTKRLSNTTMETYQQGNDTLSTGGTCFSCHTGDINHSSHIFANTRPLFAMAKTIADNALTPKQTTAITDSVRSKINVIAHGPGQERITLYPNPAKDLLTVTMVSGARGNSRIKICDMQGRTLVQQQVFIQDATTSIQIPVSQLPAGIYFVQLYTEQGRKVLAGKFLKQ